MHNILFYINITLNVLLNVCYGKLVPNLSLLFLLTYCVFWIEATVVLCHKLVLRFFKAKVNEIHHPTPSTGHTHPDTWARAQMQTYFLNHALFNCLTWTNKTTQSLFSLPCWLPSCTVLPVWVFVIFLHFFPPHLCWSCQHVTRRPSNPPAAGFPEESLGLDLLFLHCADRNYVPAFCGAVRTWWQQIIINTMC